MADCNNCEPCESIYTGNVCNEPIDGKCVFYTGLILSDLGIDNTKNSDEIITILVNAIKSLSNRIDNLEV